MTGTQEPAARSPVRRGATAVSAQVAPAALQTYELEAAHQQRTAHHLQAGYLLVLLAAPLVRLMPVDEDRRAGFDHTASALLLLAAVAMRLLLRRVAADSDWVRARRESETLRAAAWRRCMAGHPDPDDGPLGHQISTADAGTRWRFYRQHRIEDQIGYFTDRAERHRRRARRWYWIRLVLTAGTLAVATAALLGPVRGAVIGLVSALLACSEAWLQFRRSDVLAASFAEARDELRSLREHEPADDAALARSVDAVEFALERERWTWTAIMSLTVLTSSGRRPPAPPSTPDVQGAG
jgi:hypothetical protein